MKKIYIAGKLNDPACDYIKNVHHMIKTAKMVRDAGYAVYVPGIDMLEGLVDGNMEYDDYFNNSQEFLLVCDGVFVCSNWESSKGTKREIVLATIHNIPVFYSIDDLMEHRFKEI